MQQNDMLAQCFSGYRGIIDNDLSLNYLWTMLNQSVIYKHGNFVVLIIDKIGN